ncbi:HAMP domain-containing histidine kinase [Salinibacterium sp. NG253]|uniref:sensor histidine kinase n=1 Tax=Salinibacterium sp. NG253 TaxID=2792039 RepID=UPI0018CECB9F|nr:HAMP domain-containing sensor histidine kinase [Salinibacterium sp. NG253]MBH0117155.1 HAMP domain-containing histidine kinase [Salinibacterium sp. NG253]
MRRLSLRWMLLLPVLATIVVGFLAFALAVDVSESARRLAEVDAELARAEVTTVPPPADADPDAPAPRPDSLPDSGPTTESEQVPPTPNIDDQSLPVQFTVAPDGTVLDNLGITSPFAAADLAYFGATTTSTTATVDNYRVLISPTPDGVVRVTALSLDSYNAALASLRGTLVVGGVTIAVLEAAMAWFLARQIARPLAGVARSVTQIADGGLDTPIAPAGGSREIAELSTDIDRMVNRLRDALAEREQSAADATRARNDMRRLLADVAHEIRTPLTALKGYSDLYAQDMLSTPGALDRAMSRVGDESIRLNVLVNSMLQLVREGKPLEAVEEDVDLVTVAENVVDDLRVAFPSRTITTDLGAVVNVPLTGNPAQLHQALLNLVANACRHTPTDTVVAVVANLIDNEAVISIVDHGPGIAEDERDKIFQPFYRSDPSRVRSSHDGAGLGLAVTLEIALQHHGSVQLRPTSGGGATFELHLPLAEEPTIQD